ncbi:hypothetical protein K458DRAFT_366968 [Lentithecium fluviatile CBS 122367]|uniref:Sensor histidine kinase-like protein/response regulator n=1 Tax=Lentithecium fluviatile CBS 122367 TaxID=1168545 RepID=A0A6G1J322_9PLEO|nr:hypothetical protein K458DRAFT_366968 [Lentithecium fluviatile CBS 122367]
MEAPATATAIGPIPVSEARRQRDLLVRYGNAFRDIPRLELDPFADGELPSHHVPRLSKDASLTAFAQLACLRLGVSRAMISLIDGERQHILAESTPELFLRSGSYGGDASNSLWLGNVSIPRSAGVCEQVLSLKPKVAAAPEDAVIIIDDLACNTAYAPRSYVKGAPHLRFFAGVTLASPKGAVVGALCIFDDKPRHGLPKQDILHLRDLSATIVEYLESYTLKDQYRRGEQLTRALLSFADGASAVRPFEDESRGSIPFAAMESPLLPPRDRMSVPLTPRASLNVPLTLAAHSRYGSVKALQESILPAHSRSMFARAANVIRASSDLDGVLILDASVASIGNQRHGPGSNRASEGDTVTSDADTGSRSSSHEEDEEFNFSRAHRKSHSSSGKTCQVLAVATPEEAGPQPDYSSFSEVDLTRLLRVCPKGRIFNVTDDGDLMSSTDESARSGASAQEDESKRKLAPGGREQLAQAIRSLLPDARSAAFVPLWDYERSRWFASCLCWSNRPDRQLSVRTDLAYLKVFGHSVMTELARLDALASDQAKTSFVASISHELRSPLHGILGTLEFLRDTPLDSFQVSMLNSLDACGNTLLDTINHVLDYAKIGDTNKHVSSKRLKGSKGVRLSSKPLKRRKVASSPPQEPAFDLALVTEEVVEAVFSAQSYLAANKALPDMASDSGRTSSMTSSSDSSSDGIMNRKDRFVVLDIANGVDWRHHLSVGSWRRIVMNLFGNALKYTESGHVHISLRSTPSGEGTDSSRNVVLTITDSGCGMSPQFLANHVFQPFSQENPLASGTGLGLSIVRRIIETIGGKIHITSDPKSGTEVQIKLVLPQLGRALRPQPQRTRFLEILERLRGRRICILHKANVYNPGTPDMVSNYQGRKLFTKAMTNAMTEHLKMEVVHTEEWEGHDADLVICPEPSFDYLASVRSRRTAADVAPVSIFVAMDSLEAATLRTDARVVNKESVVEIMTQPCGPYKLANILNHCLNRFESAEENIWSPTSSNKSALPDPGPSIQQPIPRRPGSGDAQITHPIVTGIGESSQASEALETPSTRPTTADSLTGDFVTFDSTSPERGAREHATPSPTLTESAEIKVFTPRASAPEQGFNLEPAVHPPTQSSGDTTSQAIRGKLFPSRVLITDDNPINRKLLVAFARKHSISYQEAENGLQALFTYQEAMTNRFDVILMDISMPVMDGMSATRAIREYEREQSLPRAYVIALTGLASATARLEAWSSGVDHYVTKPVNFKALEKLFRNVREE